MKIFRLYWAIGLSCCLTENAHAQFRENESFQDIMSDSDLVIIGTPVEPTKLVNELFENPELYEIKNDGSHSPVHLRGVETTFKIEATLKGDTSSKTVVLHHYKETNLCGGNCPEFVSFDPNHRQQDQKAFLMFLVKDSEGRFAPTHGQIDPGEKAILRLSPPNKTQRP